MAHVLTVHVMWRSLCTEICLRREGSSLTSAVVPWQVWKVDECRYLLLASMHHCITDGWSVALLQRELQAAYAALLAGNKPAWAPLPVQIVDYAAWQREYITGEILDAHLEWWQTNLKAAPPLLELPWDRRRPEVAGYAGAGVPVQVPADVAAKLRDLASAEHTTLFSVLLAALQVRAAASSFLSVEQLAGAAGRV